MRAGGASSQTACSSPRVRTCPTPAPRPAPAPRPPPRREVVRGVLRIRDQTGSRVPVFIDKMRAANWPDSQTIVSEAARRGVPLMGGSVLPYVPLDRPLHAAKVEVAVAVASTPG